VEEVFGKHGRLRAVDMKTTDKGPFAFVEYEEERDAGEAIRALDARDLQGHRLRVEYSRPPPNRRDGPPPAGA
jgi:splicing factor, arginine/serine-rich 1